jgi:hypothetical protein
MSRVPDLRARIHFRKYSWRDSISSGKLKLASALSNVFLWNNPLSVCVAITACYFRLNAQEKILMRFNGLAYRAVPNAFLVSS